MLPSSQSGDHDSSDAAVERNTLQSINVSHLLTQFCYKTPPSKYEISHIEARSTLLRNVTEGKMKRKQKYQGLRTTLTDHLMNKKSNRRYG